MTFEAIASACSANPANGRPTYRNVVGPGLDSLST